MSANPQPRPFLTGDLDLLISRSLDGDLPGEEERELRSLLTVDASARARYDAMARLVGRLEELPDPETPFAMSIRVNSQLEDDTRGFAASLHRFGFYFRPATIGVVVMGIVAIAISYTVISPPKPAATVATAKILPAPVPQDDGRVNIYFAPQEKKDASGPVAKAAPAASGRAEAGPAPAGAPAAVVAQGRLDAAKGNVRQQPVLVASAEEPREKKEEATAFAPERDAQSSAAVAPAAPAASRPSGGAARTADLVQVVGKLQGTLHLTAPVRLDGLAGPFEGSYRLELDGSGRVVEAVRLFGGSGPEPAGLPARLKELSFAPLEAAKAAGSVDVKVRLP